MARGALSSRVMLIGIDRFDFLPAARGVGKRVMAPEALSTAPVNRELGWAVRMSQSGAVAVLALDDCVGCAHYRGMLVVVAIVAVIGGLILYREVFPELLVVLVVPPIHVASFMRPESIGDQKMPYNQTCDEQKNHHKQRSQHMTLHGFNLAFPTA